MASRVHRGDTTKKNGTKRHDGLRWPVIQSACNKAKYLKSNQEIGKMDCCRSLSRRIRDLFGDLQIDMLVTICSASSHRHKRRFIGLFLLGTWKTWRATLYRLGWIRTMLLPGTTKSAEYTACYTRAIAPILRRRAWHSVTNRFANLIKALSSPCFHIRSTSRRQSSNGVLAALPFARIRRHWNMCHTRACFLIMWGQK